MTARQGVSSVALEPCQSGFPIHRVGSQIFRKGAAPGRNVQILLVVREVKSVAPSFNLGKFKIIFDSSVHQECLLGDDSSPQKLLPTSHGHTIGLVDRSMGPLAGCTAVEDAFNIAREVFRGAFAASTLQGCMLPALGTTTAWGRGHSE